MNRIYLFPATTRRKAVTPALWLEWCPGGDHYHEAVRRCYRQLRRSGCDAIPARYMVYEMLHAGRVTRRGPCYDARHTA
jgi:hypothetical protein